MKTFSWLVLTLCAFATESAWAAGGAQIISYYGIILSSLGLDEHAVEAWGPVCGAILTTILLLLIGLKYRKSVIARGEDVVPDGKLSLAGLVEMILEFIHNLGKGVIGPEKVRPFLPTLFALFLFILVSNLSGLVPGFKPATESIDTNLVLGLFSFVVFNIAGMREHGIGGYLKTFAGPILLMMPFIFAIEIVGAFARPISLALRLYGNIFGDHLVLSVFTGLTYLVLPAFLLFFGLLVACIQSFVFTLLSSIYISLAISHDH